MNDWKQWAVAIATSVALTGMAQAWTKEVTVAWTCPTTNEDGSLIDDLESYTIYVGVQSNEMDSVALVHQASTPIPSVGCTETTRISLTNDTWVAVSATDRAGNESALSESIFVSDAVPGAPRVSIMQIININRP